MVLRYSALQTVLNCAVSSDVHDYLTFGLHLYNWNTFIDLQMFLGITESLTKMRPTGSRQRPHKKTRPRIRVKVTLASVQLVSNIYKLVSK